jgi:dihydroneopterin aldolase
VPALFNLFDANNDGTISYDEFLSRVRENMSQRRLEVTRQVFDSLAQRCGGKFTVEYVKKVYDASRHPHVLQSKRTADNVLVEFIETFEAHHNLDDSTSYVSWEEWLDYF